MKYEIIVQHNLKRDDMKIVKNSQHKPKGTVPRSFKSQEQILVANCNLTLPQISSNLQKSDLPVNPITSFQGKQPPFSLCHGVLVVALMILQKNGIFSSAIRSRLVPSAGTRVPKEQNDEYRENVVWP